MKYYLKVSESEYLKAAGLPVPEENPMPSEADFQKATTTPVLGDSAPRLDAGEKAEVAPIPEPEDESEAVPEEFVPENAEGPKPAILPIRAGLTQILAQNADSEPSIRHKSRAGEGIRTLDVQLGKLAFYH